MENLVPPPPDNLGRIITAILAALGGGGAIVAAGRFLTPLVERLLPSANRRMDEIRDRRRDSNARIQHLEQEIDRIRSACAQEVDEARDALYDERDAHLATKARMGRIETEYEMLRRKLDMPPLVTPENIPPEPPDPILDHGRPIEPREPHA